MAKHMQTAIEQGLRYLTSKSAKILRMPSGEYRMAATNGKARALLEEGAELVCEVRLETVRITHKGDGNGS